MADCAPWLDATALWGRAFVRTLDGSPPGPRATRPPPTPGSPRPTGLIAQAAAIRTIPGETRPEGPVRVGDGVLDTFLADAPGLR